MVNVNKLKGKIVEKGITVEGLSDKIGMNPSTFYRKMATKGTTFSIEEATSIIQELSLNDDEVMAIFFAKYVA